MASKISLFLTILFTYLFISIFGAPIFFQPKSFQMHFGNCGGLGKVFSPSPNVQCSCGPFYMSVCNYVNVTQPQGSGSPGSGDKATFPLKPPHYSQHDTHKNPSSPTSLPPQANPNQSGNQPANLQQFPGGQPQPHPVPPQPQQPDPQAQAHAQAQPAPAQPAAAQTPQAAPPPAQAAPPQQAQPAPAPQAPAPAPAVAAAPAVAPQAG